MAELRDAVAAFLALRRIAVAGVSRGKNEAANVVYRKLRDAGYEVFPVNPNADEVEGAACYPNLASIPGGIEGVVAVTHPKVTNDIVRECVAVGVRHVWMHRSFGQGSVSDEAAEQCRKNGITVIAGGCPMMYCHPVDIGHKCMRWFLDLTGGLPKKV
ncbi:MAG: CoA-binding protein [Gemmatimonadota bacterium]|nr:MAG: CoA-binding protein [Gemmatimonadota bacterium]